MTQMARDIYQAYLDRVSRALLERDIACVIDHYHLPHELASRTSSVVFHEIEALPLAVRQHPLRYRRQPRDTGQPDPWPRDGRRPRHRNRPGRPGA
jgi:hypothetical protein